MSDGLKAALEGRIGFVSSGNVAEDERTRQQILRVEANRAEGLCANGCAPMVQEDDAHAPPGCYCCPVCNYVEVRRTIGLGG